MKIKNVVIVNDFDYIQGGASKVAIETANLLVQSKEKYNVYFFSAVHSEKTTLDDKVIRVCTNQKEALHDSNFFRGFLNGIYNNKSKKEMKMLLDKLDKDETIIHFHGWTKALSCSVFDTVFKKGFKNIITLHDYFTACPNGGYYNYKRNQICCLKPLSMKCLLCNCDSRNYVFKIYRIIRQFVQNRIVKLNDRISNVISISEFSENILKKTLNNNVKVFRVYNPIDIKKKNKKINYKDNEYFLYVGRVAKEKGVDVFCEAVTQLNVRGVVVGDGPELNKLKEKYSNIDFTGWIKVEEVEKKMEKARALVFPSLWYETMGMTVQEAQNIGLPVIVNKNTAASEFVADQRFIYSSFTELLEMMGKIEKCDYKFNNYPNNYIDSLIDVYKKI